jgi:hypothetical protein
MKMSIHFHLVLRLRIGEAIPPFSQYVFIAWCLIKQWVYLHDMVLIESQEQLYIYLTQRLTKVREVLMFSVLVKNFISSVLAMERRIIIQ